MNEDFETTSGVGVEPSNEGKVTPQPASAKADETSEASEAATENDNAESAQAQEEGQEAEDGNANEGDNQPKKNGFKKRIDKLNARNTALQGEIERLKLEAQKASGQQPQQTQEPAKAIEGKPKAQDFETNAEYIDALTDWKQEQSDKKKAEKAQHDQVMADQQKRTVDLQNKITEFKKDHPDFDEVLAEVDHVVLNHAQQEAIFSSEMAPAVMYELAKNEELAAKFLKASFTEACRIVGKIESGIESAKKSSAQPKPIKTTTSAPKPMSPLGTPSKAEKSLEDMDFDEFMETRNNKKGR